MHRVKTNDGWLFTDRVYSIPLSERGTINLSALAPQFNIHDYADVGELSLRDAIIQTRDYDMLNRYLRTINGIRHQTNANYYYDVFDYEEEEEEEEEEEDIDEYTKPKLPGTPIPARGPLPPGPPPGPSRRSSLGTVIPGFVPPPRAPRAQPVNVQRPRIRHVPATDVPATEIDISNTEPNLPSAPNINKDHPLAPSNADVYVTFNSLLQPSSTNYLAGSVPLNYCLYRLINGEKAEISKWFKSNIHVTVNYNELVYIIDRSNKHVANFLQYLILYSFTHNLLDLNTLYIEVRSAQTHDTEWLPFVWYCLVSSGGGVKFDVLKMRPGSLTTATTEKIHQGYLISAMDSIDYNNIGIQLPNRETCHVIYFILMHEDHLPHLRVIHNPNTTSLSRHTSTGIVDYFTNAISNISGNILPIYDPVFLQDVVINQTRHLTYDKLLHLPFVQSRTEHVLQYSTCHSFNMPLFDFLLLNIPRVGEAFRYENLFIATTTGNVPFVDVFNNINWIVETLTHNIRYNPPLSRDLKLQPLPRYATSNIFIDYPQYKWDSILHYSPDNTSLSLLRYSPDNTIASSMSVLRSLMNLVGSPITTNIIQSAFDTFDQSNMRFKNIKYYRIVDPDECDNYTHSYVYPLFQVLLIGAIDNRLLNVSHIRKKLSTVRYMNKYVKLLKGIADNLTFAYRDTNGAYTFKVQVVKKGLIRTTAEPVDIKLDVIQDDITPEPPRRRMENYYILFDNFVKAIFDRNPTLYCPAHDDGYMNIFSFIIALYPDIIPKIITTELYIDSDLYWRDADDNYVTVQGSKDRLGINFKTIMEHIDRAAIELYPKEYTSLTKVPGILNHIEHLFEDGSLQGCHIKLRQYLLDLAHLIPHFDVRRVMYNIPQLGSDDYMLNISNIIATFKLTPLDSVPFDSLSSRLVPAPVVSLNGYMRFFVTGSAFLTYDANGKSTPTVTPNVIINNTNAKLAANGYVSVGHYIHTIIQHCNISLSELCVYIPEKKKSFIFHRALAYFAHKRRRLSLKVMYYQYPNGTITHLLYMWLIWTYPDLDIKIKQGENGKPFILRTIAESTEAWIDYVNKNDIANLRQSKTNLIFVDAMFNDDTFPTEYYQHVVIKHDLDVQSVINHDQFPKDTFKNDVYSLYEAAYHRLALSAGNDKFRIGHPYKGVTHYHILPCFSNHSVIERIQRSREYITFPVNVREDLVTFAFNEGFVDIDNTYYCKGADVVLLSDELKNRFMIHNILNSDAVISKSILHPNEASPYVQYLNETIIDKNLLGSVDNYMIRHTDNIWEDDLFKWPSWDPHDPENIASTTSRIGKNELYYVRSEQTFVVFARQIRANKIFQFDIMTSSLMTDALIPELSLGVGVEYRMHTKTLAQRFAELAVLSNYLPYPEYLVYVPYEQTETENPHEKPKSVRDQEQAHGRFTSTKLVVMYWLKQARDVYGTREFVTLNDDGDVVQRFSYNNMIANSSLPFNDICVSTTPEELAQVAEEAEFANLKYDQPTHIPLLPHLIMFSGVSFERICTVQTPTGIDIAVFYLNEPIHFINDDNDSKVPMDQVIKLIPPSEDTYFDYNNFYFYNRAGVSFNVARVHRAIARDRYLHVVDGYKVDPAMMTNFRLYVTLMESVLFHLDFTELINVSKAFSFDNVYEFDQYYGKLTLNEAMHVDPARPPARGSLRQRITALFTQEIAPFSHVDESVFIRPPTATNSTVLVNIPDNVVARIKASP